MGDPAAAGAGRSVGDEVVTLSEQIERNQLTIEELEAVVVILDQMARGELVKSAMAKMRWHIAASRNEVEYGG